MVSFFKTRNSASAAQLIVLCIAVHIRLFFGQPATVVADKNSLLYFVLSPIGSLPSIAVSCIYLAVVIVEALLLNFVVSRFRMLNASSSVVAMCFILFSGLLPVWSSISEALVMNIFLIWLIEILGRMYGAAKVIPIVFNCGLVVGFATILFTPFCIIIVVALIAILILRPFKANEIFSYWVGVILPFYFLCAILFLNDKLNLIKDFIPHLNWHIVPPENKLHFLIAAIAILFCVLFGFISLQNNFGRLLISARKLWIIIVLQAIFLLGSLLFFSTKDLYFSLCLLLPNSAAIAGNLFNYGKQKFLLSLLFWLLLIACLFNSFELEKMMMK